MNIQIDRETLLSMEQPEMKHKRMPASERAAQFSPFAALTGYERLVEESGQEFEEEMDHV